MLNRSHSWSGKRSGLVRPFAAVALCLLPACAVALEPAQLEAPAQSTSRVSFLGSPEILSGPLNGPAASLGRALAISGNTLVIGAPRSSAGNIQGDTLDPDCAAEAVYIYERVGGKWIHQATLSAEDGPSGGWFGQAVALAGDLLVVGAPRAGENVAYDDPGDMEVSFAGLAHVYRRRGSRWKHAATLRPLPKQDLIGDGYAAMGGFWFGGSVAVCGETIAIGAQDEPMDQGPVPKDLTGRLLTSDGTPYTGSSGAVYIFEREGDAWKRTQHLKGRNPGKHDAFGCALALFDNTLAVGASWDGSGALGVNGAEPDESRYQSGAAYVYVRDGEGWKEQAFLKASNPSSNDSFGHALGLHADVLVVGAPREDGAWPRASGDSARIPRTADDSGAAYVFSRSAGTWLEEAYLKSSRPTRGGNFGYSVSVADDSIALAECVRLPGTKFLPHNVNYSAGRVSVFSREFGAWGSVAEFESPAGDGEDWFGSGLAIHPLGLAVGAPHWPGGQRWEARIGQVHWFPR